MGSYHFPRPNQDSTNQNLTTQTPPNITTDVPLSLRSPSLEKEANSCTQPQDESIKPSGNTSAVENRCSVSSIGSGSIDAGDSSSKVGSQDSLIFERYVQDPLVDPQPVPSSLPRHFSLENYVPPSLDTATGLITGSETSDDMTLEQLEMSIPSRRSSAANLEAAFAKHGSPRSRSSSRARSSRSNLTRQLRGNKLSSRPLLVESRTAPQLTLSSFGSNGREKERSLSNDSHRSNRRSLQQSQEQQSQQSQKAVFPPSPLLRDNKSTSSFFSYADMLDQEDQESNFPIRRPSLSLSLSSQRMGRSNSSASCIVSPRSPSSIRGMRSPIFTSIRRNSNVRFTSPFSPSTNYGTFSQSPVSSDSEEENDASSFSPSTDLNKRLVGLSRRSSTLSRTISGRRIPHVQRAQSISSDASAKGTGLSPKTSKPNAGGYTEPIAN